MGKKRDGLTAKERKAEAAAIKRAQKAEKKDEEKAKQDAIAQLRREIAVIPPELKVPTASPADRDEEEVPPSQIGRKRKMKPLSLGERRKYPIGHELATPEPTTISPELRMQQYPNHGLRSYEDGNNRPCLFCDMCNCPVSLIKQRIEIHLQTNKHLDGIKREERLRARQLQFDESITSTDRAYGDTLLKSITDARLSVLYALMQAAVPREKL